MQTKGQRRIFESVPVDDNIVSEVLKQHWPSLTLGKRIKASQNVTYEATQADGQKVVVRATALSDQKERVKDECIFLQYLVENKLSVCGPISPNFVVSEDSSTIVTVTKWAEGSPVIYTDFDWATNRGQVEAQGRWLRQLHDLSRQFTKDHPEVASRIQNWDDVHCGSLKGVQEPQIEKNADNFGVIHGDLNPSNFFIKQLEEGAYELSVFDWDQTQRGWYLYDMAQAIQGVFFASRLGSIMGPKASQLNVQQFTDWICEAYGEDVDRDALSQCLRLRNDFYERVCRRAKAEGDLPADMAGFIHLVVDSFDKKLFD